MDTCSHPVKRLDFRALFTVYLRSFFFQGSFSVKERQNIGFAYCIEPVGSELYTQDSERRAFQLRHTEFFNVNPFMSTLVLGAVAHMEERLLDDGSVTSEDISRFKASFGKVCGSVGDRFFWTTLRPFCLVFGLLGTLFYGIWGIVLFLAIFNASTMILKWHWLTSGYRLGPMVVHEIRKHYINNTALLLERISGIAIAFFTVAFLSGSEYGISWITAGTILLFSLSILLFSKKLQHSLIFFLCTAIALILGFLVEMFV